ncbi:MAG: hypothetical protein AABY58_09480 [Nitrospirota bacterium]
MRALAHKEKLILTDILSSLLDELDEECLKTIRLIGNLRKQGLTEEQLEDMLGELSAAATHLKVHSEQVEKAIEEELDKEA